DCGAWLGLSSLPRQRKACGHRSRNIHQFFTSQRPATQGAGSERSPTMSKNFELLRQASGQAEILPPPEPRAQAHPASRLVYARPLALAQYEDDWERFSTTLKKHRKLAAQFAVATFVAVAIVTFLMRPVYEPVAQLEVDPPGAEVFSMQGNGAAPTDAEYL